MGFCHVELAHGGLFFDLDLFELEKKLITAGGAPGREDDHQVGRVIIYHSYVQQCAA